MAETTQLIKPKWKKRSDETSNQHQEWLESHSPESILIGTSMFERFQYMKEAMRCWRSSGLAKLPDIFNCSVGGDCIANILYRLQDRQILGSIRDRSKVRKIVLMAGANDVEKGRISQMIQGMRQILAIIRETFPDVPVHVMGVYPRRSDKVDEKRVFGYVQEFNALLEAECSGAGLSYHYFGGDVVDSRNKPQKRYFVDNVHFSAAGYEKLAGHLHDILTHTE